MLADQEEMLTSTRLLPFAGVCVLLVAFGLIGYNPNFQSNATVHWLGQLITGMLLVFCGVFVLRSKTSASRNAFFFATFAFIGAGILDMSHGFMTIPGSRPELASALIPWGWLPSRIYFSTMLCLALWARLYEQRGGETGRLLFFSVCVLASAYVVGCISFFWNLPVPLPQAYYPDSAIHRPAELVPAVLFSCALLACFFRGNWRDSRFEYYLLLAFLMFVACHSFFMPFAEKNFDSFFIAGMLCKITGTLLLITGVILQSRLHLHQETQAQKNRQQAIVDVAVDAIITFDIIGTIDTFNPAAEKMYGYSAREMIGSNINRLSPSVSHRAQSRDRQQVIKMGGIPADVSGYVTVGQHKNGSTFPVESASSSVEVNGEPLFTSIIRDISETAERQEKLTETTERLALALDSAGLGIWQLNLDTQELHWDQQMYVLYDRDPNDGCPSDEVWVGMTHPDDKEACLSASRNAIENDVPIDLEFRIILPDGATRWIKGKGRRVDGTANKAISLIGINHDITDRKQHQQELEVARTEAVEANRAKSAFLATMSHEIRTPLNGVIGMTEVLQQTNLQEHQSDMAGLIRQSAFSLLGIIEDVLDFSKIEAGRLEIDPTPVELEELVEDVCAIQISQAKKNGVDLCLFVDPQIPKNLLGDGQRTRQILTNLVSNAIKFSSNQDRQGRVSLRIRPTSVGRNQAVIECSVTDNGIGMDEATKQRLFRPFSQADASTSRNFGGTGLGLTISQSLAKLMGGEIVAQSEHGEGSTFTARLPFTILPSSQGRMEAETDLSGITCLTIGGTESIMPDLGVYLAHAGATVEHVLNQNSILELTSEDQSDPKVWVIDLGLNQFSEEELTYTLQRHPRAVVLTRDDRLRLQLEASGAIAVDDNILRRITFLQAVASAAGLSGAKASSETVSEANEDDFVPPSRREALEQNRLVLVAEDNETNQKVIQYQLTKLGYCADVANHGEEALRQWRTGEYALLLTDLQMPEMDGYQLAQAIRSEENPPVRIPIVALTANTLAGEAEHCIAVGMDDYLSKPASLANVDAVLAKWLPATEEPVTEARNSQQASSGISKIAIDLTVLENSVGTGLNVIDSVLEGFPAQAASIGEDLRRAFTSGQPRTLEKAAHKLRSSAVTVGARALGELCTSIEDASLARSGPFPAEQQAALLAQLDTELAAIDKFIEKRLVAEL